MFDALRARSNGRVRTEHHVCPGRTGRTDRDCEQHEPNQLPRSCRPRYESGAAKLCEFALSYQRQLPDFIAQQTTTFHGAKSKTILTAQVTYRKGQESYSLLTLDGEPITPNTSIPPDVRFTSAGEFGSLLVSLFKVHGAIEFKFREASTLRNVPAAVYTFHLDQPKNTFWTLRDAAGVDWKPEFRGELWLEKATGRPLREVLEPVHLPSQCLVKSAKTVTDYAMTPVAEIGTFLLPIKSESTVCGRGTWTNPSGCSTNILVFHDYQKFGTTSRILPSDAQP